MPVTVLLVDDHKLVRQGCRMLLEKEEAFRVVAETGSGLEAVKLATSLHPDLLIVDVMLPGLNGLEVTRQVCQRLPHIRVIVLSMYANEAYVLEALLCGASGYVLKDASSSELVQAVRDVIAGRRYLSPPLSERAIEAYIEKTRASTSDPYKTLTTREREVLQLAAEGYTNPQIATALGVSPRTVETHRANLMHKLDLHTHTDLIRYALRRGILPLEL